MWHRNENVSEWANVKTVKPNGSRQQRKGEKWSSWLLEWKTNREYRKNTCKMALPLRCYDHIFFPLVYSDSSLCAVTILIARKTQYACRWQCQKVIFYFIYHIIYLFLAYFVQCRFFRYHSFVRFFSEFYIFFPFFVIHLFLEPNSLSLDGVHCIARIIIEISIHRAGKGKIIKKM